MRRVTDNAVQDTHIVGFFLEELVLLASVCLSDMAIHKVDLQDICKLAGLPVNRRGQTCRKAYNAVDLDTDILGLFREHLVVLGSVSLGDMTIHKVAL